MKPIASVKFDNPIVDITIIPQKRYLLVTDSNTIVNLLNIGTLDIKNQLKINAIQEKYPNKVVAFSSNAIYLAIIASGAKESKLFNITTKKLVATVSRNQGGVSCIAIDPKDRYMFSCGEDGSIFCVDIKSGQLAFTLPRHVDAVNDIAFSKNAHLVATASYDRNINLFDFASMSLKTKLRAHIAPVMRIQFLTKNRLLSIDKKNSAIVWDLVNYTVITRLQGIHDDITRVVFADERFIFIATKLGYILAYDASTYKLISHRFIKVDSSITVLFFDEITKHLYIAAEDGHIFVYNIYNNEQNIAIYFEEKKYDLLQECVNDNPLLSHTKTYETFELLWQKSIQKARGYLELCDKEKAKKVVENFLTIPSKKQYVQKLFNDFTEYDKFLQYIKQNKIALAYAMVNTYPIYKETKIFKDIEAQWVSAMQLAQKQLQIPNSLDKIKEILAPYRGVSEKMPIIQDFMQNYVAFSRFKASLGEKNFKMAFEYVKKHPFLRTTKEYDSLMTYSDTLYIKAKKLQASGDTHSAIKLYKVLIDFEDFRDEVKLIISEIENEHKFYAALRENDLSTAYNLLSASEILQTTKDGIKLEEVWDSDYTKAGVYASDANIDGVKSALANYLGIKSKFIAIATVVSWCYLSELDNAIKNKVEQKAIENGIKNFVLYFGVTEQLGIFFDNFLAAYPTTKLNLESLKKSSLENWKPSMIVKSILD